MALFKKRKSTKEKLAEKKKEMEQKKQGKLKAASVKDLTREVKSDKEIAKRNRILQANKDAGERLKNFFYPIPSNRPKPKKKIRTTGSDAAKDRANIKTAKPRTLRTTGSDAAKDRKNLSFTKPKTAPTGPGSTKSLMPKTYTIKAGDNLTAIAKKMNTTVAMLKAANNIKDANKIRKGQKIKIYRDANKTTTKPKDTRPRTIAQAQKMGKKYFFDKNGNRKAAVTAAQLKKSGLTLSQWLKKN